MATQLFSESPCGPACIPPTDVPAQVGQLRLLLRHVALMGAFALGFALGIVATFTSRGTAQKLMRIWSRVFLRAIGVRVEVIGDLAPTRPVLLVLNHLTIFDAMAGASQYPFVLVVTHQALRNPVIGPLLRHSGAIFLERGQLAGVAPLLADMTRALRDGGSVAVAPEGRLRCSPPGGPFKTALLQSAIDARVPVRPVMLRCRLSDGRPTSQASMVWGDWSLALRSVMRIRGLVLELRVLQDIETVPCRDRKELARLAKRSIDAAAAGLPVTCAHAVS